MSVVRGTARARLLFSGLLVASLVTLLVGISAGVAQCAAPCPELTSRIAYVTPFGQLAVVDPSAGEPRLISPVGVTYQFPAFSPDGTRIAAIGVADGEGMVSIFGGPETRQAYRSAAEPPIYLYWAPDGASLSFIAARPESGLGFHIADLDGTARLVATGSPFYWAWDHDAASLLAHVGLTGEGSRLAFADPDTGIAEGDLDPPGFFQAPGISPSGRFIAYATVAPGGDRRVVVASHPFVAGEVVRREFSHQGFAMLGWNPVSDVVAVMSPPQAAPHWFGPIQVLDAADGLLEPVVDGVALAFFWSPDGTKLAWLSPVAAPDVQQVVDTRTGSQGVGDSLPSPAQQASVRLRLHVVDIDGLQSGVPRTLTTFAPSAAFVNQFLPFFDQYALSHRIWSPNSDALALPMIGSDGVTRVVVVDLDGTQREVAQGDMPAWNVR